ncbi:hypothetical protein N9K77_00310 [bacterium]|nr:hypothetical protein [bacterium]
METNYPLKNSYWSAVKELLENAIDAHVTTSKPFFKNKHEFQGIGILYNNEGVLIFKQKSNNLLSSSYGLMPLNIDEFKMSDHTWEVIK